MTRTLRLFCLASLALCYGTAVYLFEVVRDFAVQAVQAFARPAAADGYAHPLAALVQAVQFALYRRRLEARDRPHVRDTLRLCA